jgi:uncharacterized protein YjiS (DUF1127 family)
LQARLKRNARADEEVPVGTSVKMSRVPSAAKPPVHFLSCPTPARLARPQCNSWRTFAPWRVIQVWAERRRQRTTLGELIEEKHLLDDIGLTRAQALREAAKPFWQR